MSEPFYKTGDIKLILDDSFDAIKKIKNKSIDMIFADPPYFLSNNGVSCHSGKQVNVNKGDWDKGMSPIEKLKWNRRWLKLCRRVLKDNGSIWISGTFHNIYSIGVALELEGYSIINNITWQKPNPAPNLACRCFTNSTETVLWARKQITPKKKGKHYFDYSLMKEENGGKQMKDVWVLPLPKKSEKEFGHHPTQKPVSLLTRIVLASTKENDLVLDPFCGSATTGVVCVNLNRKFVGIDNSEEYLKIAQKRLEKEKTLYEKRF
ncbi:MAG: site-specific DNA-methyltransferase [Bacilli bacterium]|jgi:site-specific DNA-methyltransferase (adenine-specific)|nr:site-specific DNA-methyltransferase [Bacilli bacterium]